MNMFRWTRIQQYTSQKYGQKSQMNYHQINSYCLPSEQDMFFVAFVGKKHINDKNRATIFNLVQVFVYWNARKQHAVWRITKDNKRDWEREKEKKRECGKPHVNTMNTVQIIITTWKDLCILSRVKLSNTHQLPGPMYLCIMRVEFGLAAVIKSDWRSPGINVKHSSK